ESSALELSLAVSHSFYVFPGLRNRNPSHIPVRRENVLQQTGGFRTSHLQGRHPHKYRSYSTLTRLLNLSSASSQTIPTAMQIRLTIAEPAVRKLWTGMIMTVAAITMPTMPWKAME